VYLISEKDEDEAFDDMDYVHVFEITDEWIDVRWSLMISERCLVLFDDVNAIVDKKVASSQ